MTTEEKIRAYVSEQQRRIFDEARKGFEKKGRGHLMVVIEGPGFKPNSYAYINEFDDKRQTRLQPKQKDEVLTRMVSDYDPQTQAVVICFLGTQYLRFTLTAPAEHGDAENFAANAASN